MAIVLIAIGLLFTGVDFMVGSGISYPDFIQPTGLYHGIDIHLKNTAVCNAEYFRT
ncbi:MAG: hypothetical protein ACLSD6_05100 [Clostridium sp.]